MTRTQFRRRIRSRSIILGAVGAYGMALLIQKEMYCWSLLPFILLVFGAFLEFIWADIAERRFPDITEDLLNVLKGKTGKKTISQVNNELKKAIKSFKVCDPEKISATVHCKIPLLEAPEPIYLDSSKKKERFGLLQLTDYVGPSGGDKGRITLLEQGIIGRCSRTEELECVNFSDEFEYERRMVEEFGFSKEEMKSHTLTARSYLAVPIIFRSDLKGVLYFFSMEPQVFPHAASEKNLKSYAKSIYRLLRKAGIITDQKIKYRN